MTFEQVAPLAVEEDGEDAPPLLAEGTHPHSDLANAERLIAMHGEDLRHAPDLGGWFHYDERRWRRDEAAARRASWHVARKLLIWAARARAEAEKALNDPTILDDEPRRELAKLRIEQAKKAWKHAAQSQSSSRLKAILDVAEAQEQMAVRSSAFDRDPLLFNCANGVVDLRTGELRPHRREDMISKLSPVAYDRAARSDLWERVLAEATGDDEEMIAFLRRAVGYSLTADVSEEKLFFVHGPAAAGKSTLLEAIKATLGDYAATANFETFIARPEAGGIRNDVARLAGSRMVVSIEVDEGKKLAEGLVKMLTGGDTISARFLYREEFEFKPGFKLWLAANHAPRVRDDDGAMWRRILRVPFERVVPPEKRDPRVKAALTNASVSGPAILAWAVRGCLEWQKEGLGVPASVARATDAYRAENDPLREFIEECVELVPGDQGSWVSRAGLRAAYEHWAKENGARFTLSPKEFTARIRALGCDEASNRGPSGQPVRTWRCLRLRRFIPGL